MRALSSGKGFEARKRPGPTWNAFGWIMCAGRGRAAVRDDRVRLGDILEAIERIEKYAGQRRDALYSDELVQTWVVHHLMIIGEACRALSPEFRAARTDRRFVCTQFHSDLQAVRLSLMLLAHTV